MCVKEYLGEIRVHYCVFIKMSCNPRAVVQILVNEVTKNYTADKTHPTHIDRQTAQELFIILEKHISGDIDMWMDRHCGVIVMEHRKLYLKIMMCSVVQFITWRPVPVPMNHYLPN